MSRPMVARMGDAAAAWLAALTDRQCSIAAAPFPADEDRRRWFYTPTDHGGLALRDMDEHQQQLACALLASALSRAGYLTAVTVMGLESVLDELEQWPRVPQRGRVRDALFYQFRVFGSPDGPAWGWRLGGHHLSLNFTVLDGNLVSATPSFFGADPATSPLLGSHFLRPLGAFEDLAQDLVHALDDDQREIAVVSPVAPVDIISGNRPRVSDGDNALSFSALSRSPAPDFARFLDDLQRQAEDRLGTSDAHRELLRYRVAGSGLRSTQLRSSQRRLLDTLLDCYLSRLPDDVAEYESVRLASMDLWFVWAGSIEPGLPHYYRVQGRGLLVEYDNTQRDGNHAHSVWRDPIGDFGGDALDRHYESDH